MHFHQRFVPGLAIASYLIGDDRTGEAVVIDPTRDVDAYIRFAKANGLHIRHIIETHVHADFVCGSRELKARLNERPMIHCSGCGGDEWTQPFADNYLNPGDEIVIGKLRLIASHVPGHTPEHIAIGLYDTSRSDQDPWMMFTGDFLFVGDVGRPDLLGDDTKQELAYQLYQSVFEGTQSLPDFTEIYPAHGAGSLCGKAIGSRRWSTMGYERRFSHAMQPLPRSQWVEQLLDDMPISPPYFQRMKKVNLEGPAIVGDCADRVVRRSADEVYEQRCGDCLVLDVRSKEAFAASHIPHSINIPFGENLPVWAGWVLPYDRPLLIVTDDATLVPEVATHLMRVGFDQLSGYVEGGIGTWEQHGFPIGGLATASVHHLHQRLRSKDSLTIVDVRTNREWEEGHIESALHVHGGVLQERSQEIPKDNPVYVICGSGYRASIASSFLRRAGFEDVTNVLGGMSAWKANDYPVVEGDAA